MSRSNHYRICEGHEHDRYYREFGDCSYHDGGWRSRPCRYGEARQILGRRTWKRKSRYPRFSVKSYMNGPSRWWWKSEHKAARAKYKQMMLRSDDPALPRERDLIDLWGWY